jgi:putative restriction endonuclease
MEYPSCVCALRGRQAATRNGFPVDPEKRDRWLLLRSPWTRHQLLVTYESPKFVVATASTALATEAAREFITWDGATPPGTARAFCADAGAPLHALIKRFYQLALALPPEPLLEFEEKVAELPRQTEAERLVVQRIGQDVFRKSLMEYWRATCPITGITQPELLRASHIKPWADCASDAERLDVFQRCCAGATADSDCGRPRWGLAGRGGEDRWHGSSDAAGLGDPVQRTGNGRSHQYSFSGSADHSGKARTRMKDSLNLRAIA